MLALQAITPEHLSSAIGIPIAEARKVIAQVHRGEQVRPTSAVRRQTAEAVRAAGDIPALRVIEETPSAIDPFVKYLVEAPDGARFETVRIPLEVAGRFTACVSSQVGCALACAFCATGRMGLQRNLAAWEIVEQVRIVRAALPGGRVHGVVFQGMGEPMANLDSVLEAIAVLTEPCALGIDARAITVCTSGLPGGIVRLAKEQPNVRLGISIGSAIAERRKPLMPITKAHSLADVLAAAEEHARLTGLSPMWAVTLLAGVNDSDDDARALAERARAFEVATGRRPRLSIIPFNAIDGDPFQRSPREPEFRAALGLPSHRRYSGGSDVGAACGQLVAHASGARHRGRP
jgi:23S rRNA (adenine2503-C2)-methyltransferase